MKDSDTPYHHGDLRLALVQAGLDLLEEVGLEKMSMRAIAARVGVSHTAPKNHFDSYDGLLAAIAAEGFRRHAAYMKKDMTKARDMADRLRCASEGYVEFAANNKALFQLMFQPRWEKGQYPELREAATESYEILGPLSEGLNWPRRDGTGKDDNLQTAMMLWTLVHGYASLLIEGHMARDDNGAPIFDVMSVMPDFKYDSDA